MAKKKKKTSKKKAKKTSKKKASKKKKKVLRITAEQKFWALLSYICILFILPLIFKRKDKFIHFHAKQGLVFFIVGFAASIFLLIPVIGWILGSILIVVLAVFLITAIVHELFGEMWKMPLIGNWSEEMNL